MADAGLSIKLDNAEITKAAINNLERLLSGFDSALNQTAGALDTFDRNLIKAAKDAASTNSQLLALTKTMGSFDASVSKIAPTISKLADDLVRGFASGSLSKGMTDVAAKAANSVIDTFKKIFGIHSPSIVMASFADFLQEGFVTHVKPQEYGKAGAEAGTAFVEGFDKATDQPFRALALKLKQRGQLLIQNGIQDVLRGGIAAFLQGELVSQVGNFDQVLNQIRVYGKLTSDTVKSVQDDILKFAEVSQFDPQQVATAFLGLQKAGLSVKDSLSTLPPIIDLATAGQIDLARATDLTIRTAQGLGIPFSEATRVVNAFVAGADISTANVEDFGQALQYIAPSARNLHIPIEQLTTAIALLNDQGIVGERAGTGLRAALDSLIAPSSGAREALQALGVRVRDAKGNFVGFPNLLDQFATSIDKLRKRGAGDAQIVELLSKLGDRNTAQAILALTARTSEGGSAFEDYAKKLSLANTAQDIAQEQMKTFNGVVESFRGSIQSLIIKAFQPLLDNVLAPLIKIATDVVNALANIPEPILNIAAAVGLLASAFVTLNGVMKIANGAILLISGGALEGLGAALAAITGILFNPVGVIAGFGGLLATAVALLPVIALLGAGIYVAVKAVEDIAAQIKNNVGGAGDAFRGFLTSIQSLFGTVIGLFEELGRLVGSVLGSFNSAFGQKLSVDNSGIVNLLRTISNYIENIRKGLENVRQLLAFVNAARGNDGGQGQSANQLLEQRATLMERLDILNSTDLANEQERIGLLQQQQEIENRLAFLSNQPKNLATSKEENKLLQDREAILRRLGILSGEATKGLVGQGKAQQNYVVKANDTLYGLARRYKTTVAELMKLNNITDPRLLRTGSTIKIPVQLTDEKEAIKAQLAEIAKNLPGGGIDLPLDASSLAARFAEFAKSDLFRNIFGEVNIDQAVVQIAQLEKGIRDFADAIVHFKLDKLIPESFTVDLSGFKTAIETAITGLGNITNVDTSGVQKFIQNHIPTEIKIDFSALKKSIEAGINSIFGGGGVEPGFGKEYAKQAGFDPGKNIVQRIVESFSNINLDDLKKVFEDNFGKVLTVLISAAALVFGGPIGATIGLAKLVVLAVGEDFLGIGTTLKNSGALADIEKGFEDLKKGIEDAFNAVFNGGKKDKPPGDRIVDDYKDTVPKVLSPIQQVIEDLKGLPKNLGTTFQSLGEGLIGFINNLKGVDASGIPRVLEVIAGFFGGIGTLIARGVGDALPSLGSALKDFIEVFSNLGKGDIGGVATSLLKVVGDIIGAVVNFSVPAADAVIEFIEKLFNLKLPTANESLQGALQTLNNIFLIVQITVENVGRDIENFFRLVSLGVLQLRRLASPGDGSEQRALDKQIADLKNEITSRDIGKELTDTIAAQLGQNTIDLGKFLNLGIKPEDIAKQLSTTQRGNVLAGIQKAFEEEDQSALSVLLPIAASPSFDPKATSKAIQDALDLAIKNKDAGTIKAILPFAPQFKLDTSQVPAEIKQQIADAADDASNLGTVQTPENTKAPITFPVTVTPDVKLELDKTKFDAGLGTFLAEQFKGGANRDELITAVTKYSSLPPEDAAAVVDAFLSGVQDSLATAAKNKSISVKGKGGLHPAAVALADLEGIGGEIVNDPKFHLAQEDITKALEQGITTAFNSVDLTSLSKPGSVLDPKLINAIGINITDGIGVGLTTGGATLGVVALQTTQQSVIDVINNALGIHSPSEYGITVGEALLEGIGVGLTDFLYLVQNPIDTIVGLFGDIAEGAEDARNRVLSAVGVTSIGIAVPLIIITALTYNYANAWQTVADNATKAENAIRAAIKAGNGGNNPTGAGTPPPGMAGGGNVYAGNVYRIFDTNNPEVYQTPDATYLLPAKDGMITPIRGGNTVTNNNSYAYGQPINITINAPANADLNAIRQAAQAGVEAAQAGKPKVETRLINGGIT